MGSTPAAALGGRIYPNEQDYKGGTEVPNAGAPAAQSMQR
jgi:hypothetical protein